jgi:quercetin dioxygenase-like cupin family protein
MTALEFEAQLQAEKFDEITRVDKPVGYQMGEHQHPFEACALILKGDITLQVDAVSSTYREGDIFRLPAHTLHCESAIAHGVTYLAGRKHPSAA